MAALRAGPPEPLPGNVPAPGAPARATLPAIMHRGHTILDSLGPFAAASALGAAALAGCEGGTDDGGTCPVDEVAIVGLATTAHLERDPRAGPGTIESRDAVEPGRAIPLDDYLLEVSARIVREPRRRAGLDPLALPIGSAHALSCADAVRSSESIADLSVRAEGGAPALGSAGVRIVAESTLFDPAILEGPDGSAPGVPQPRPARVDVDGAPLLADWLAGSPLAPPRFYLAFDGPLEAPATVRLTIDYALAGGDAFSILTDPVTLAPARGAGPADTDP